MVDPNFIYKNDPEIEREKLEVSKANQARQVDGFALPTDPADWLLGLGALVSGGMFFSSTVLASSSLLLSTLIGFVLAGALVWAAYLLRSKPTILQGAIAAVLFGLVLGVML